ncbi:MAG: glycosyltransferase [Flavobacteriales bacterium]|nr:glycosyltransferase [Flavobacteriales bacterium]
MTEKPRLLHITPWYPSDRDPMHAIWIQRHVELLATDFENHVLHIEFHKGAPGRKTTSSGNTTRSTLSFPLGMWRIREWLYGREVRRFLRKNAGFHLVNFYIAYPAAVCWPLFKRWLPGRVFITEHWSYYHYHFYSTHPLNRVKKIFSRQIPVITVSEALRKDIEKFSGYKFPSAVVFNVVDTSVFRYTHAPDESGVFFMVSYWKDPKQPHLVIRALAQLRQKSIKLRIAGYGPMWDSMVELSRELQLEDSITFLGPLSGDALVREMNSATAFIHPTGYETFSVVVAEALCCGCPVLCPDAGALSERVDSTNGILKTNNESYDVVIERFLDRQNEFNRKEIAAKAALRYSPDAVRTQFRNALNTLFSHH